MKTFFWTNIAWIIILGTFWLTSPYSLYGESIRRKLIPQDIKTNIRLEGVNEGKTTCKTNSDNEENESQNGEIQTENRSEGISTGGITTGINLTQTGNSSEDSELIVTVVGTEKETDSTKTPLTESAAQKEIIALTSRVDALEYHLLMLMQSLQQPKGQPKAIPMQYPVWNYSLNNTAQN